MPRLVVYCMGVTVTHTLPPLKRGGLSVEAQFMGIPVIHIAGGQAKREQFAPVIAN
jgi:hypothetical protein